MSLQASREREIIKNKKARKLWALISFGGIAIMLGIVIGYSSRPDLPLKVQLVFWPAVIMFFVGACISLYGWLLKPHQIKMKYKDLEHRDYFKSADKDIDEL